MTPKLAHPGSKNYSLMPSFSEHAAANAQYSTRSKRWTQEEAAKGWQFVYAWPNSGYHCETFNNLSAELIIL